MSDDPERGCLKEVYRGHELEVKREQAMGGWDNLYYSAYRVRDGYGAIDSFTSDESPLADFMKELKEMLDERMKEVKEAYPDGHCICGETIPEDATSESDCEKCGHEFCSFAEDADDVDLLD